ncbi:hypothetical protein D3C87_1494630 [compost metagenome]
MILSAFFLFLLSNPAHAEYRVFVLKIAKRAPASAPGTAPAPSSDYRLVHSTLDPEQYRGYYTVLPDEDITYIDTWRCYGRTDNFKDFCPNPKAQNAAVTTPAS